MMTKKRRKELANLKIAILTMALDCVSAAQVRDKLRVPSKAASKMLHSFEGRGLLERFGNGERLKYKITPDGLDLLENKAGKISPPEFGPLVALWTPRGVIDTLVRCVDREPTKVHTLSWD